MTAIEIQTKIKKRGIKQQFIADSLGKSKGLVSQWVNGTTKIPAKYIIQINALIN